MNSDFTNAANLHLAHRRAGVQYQPLCGICEPRDAEADDVLDAPD